MRDTVKAQIKKLREPLWRDAWYVFDFFGHRAYADSGLCLVGEPPSKNTRPLEGPGVQKLTNSMALRTAPMSIKSKNSAHIYFDGLHLPIDARYYDHVLSEYPSATFHRPKRGDATKPITIKNRGEIVGAVMCMNVW